MKKITGKIISDKMDKRAVVGFEVFSKHPLYKKILKKVKTVHAVNELGAKKGQTVKMIEIKPVSKTVCFKITEIVSEKEILKETK